MADDCSRELGGAGSPEHGGGGRGGNGPHGGGGSRSGNSPQTSDGLYDGPAFGRTAAPAYSTACRLGKQYSEIWPVSADPDKTSGRGSDGHVSSAQYFAAAQRQRNERWGGKGNGARRTSFRGLDLEYHHWLEDLLASRVVRRILGFIARPRPGRKPILQEAIESYADSNATIWRRLVYWPIHSVIRRIKGGTSDEVFRRRVAEHSSTVRGLVLASRSIAEFGLSFPQRFSAPMFLVWNFTNACNLRCRHCYQDTKHRRLPDELNLAEKLAVIDQAGELSIPMIAFAGGEPTIDRDLLPALRRCHDHGIHTSVATNGATMTPKLAAQLAEAGASYIEISLDSVDPQRHDAFRGVPGMWERTVRGMRIVTQTPGLRLGVAMCVHQGNYAEVEQMIQFAVDIGATTFAHFNFIPVGRGLEMVEGDLSPRQREQLLLLLNKWMQSGRIGVLSTSPQLGKVCLAHAPVGGLTAASHAGSGAGLKARVLAKYLGGCGAGRCYNAIEPNGDVTPCVYLPHRVLGNVRQRPLVEIFRGNKFWEITCDRSRRLSHCEVCRFRAYCGGCLARSDAYYGVLNAGDPGCLFNEKHWEELVRRGVARDPTVSSRDCEQHENRGEHESGGEHHAGQDHPGGRDEEEQFSPTASS
jgi:radical SAM protein with 4Fe4S-binding SPASM domain